MTAAAKRPTLLLVFSTIDGHTVEICHLLARVAEDAGYRAVLRELRPGSTIDIAHHDRVVIGASIRYGKHRPEVTEFIEQHAALLQQRNAAFFSVNAVARKPDKRSPESNPYVRKFLKTISWQPACVGIFAGKIDYPKYGTFDRSMIRFIMWLTGGPTDPSSTTEFTDWVAVKQFGDQVCCAR